MLYMKSYTDLSFSTGWSSSLALLTSKYMSCLHSVLSMGVAFFSAVSFKNLKISSPR
jgi:hypothetical protein